MPRLALRVLMSLLIVLATAGTTFGIAGHYITVSGKLEYVTDLESPHYQVGGWVILYDTNRLAALRGKEVVISGTEVKGPSIYMTRLLAAQRVEEKTTPGETHPVPPPQTPGPFPGCSMRPPSSPPTPPPGEVTIPVMPPDWDLNRPDFSPKPVPVHGTPYFLLVGLLEARYDGPTPVDQIARTNIFCLRTRGSGGLGKVQVTSSTVNLTQLVGHQIAVVGSFLNPPDDAPVFNVLAAIDLHADFAGRLDKGGGLIYSQPPGVIRVTVKGREIVMDQKPFIGNGRALVGLRAVTEALGSTVTWDAATRTVLVKKGDRLVTVTVGSNQAMVRNGQNETLLDFDTAPVIANSRVMVPLRLIAEGLGLAVNWDEAKQTVTIE